MIKKDKVFFKNKKGLNLAGILISPEEYSKTILFSCGIGAVKEEWLDWQEIFAEKGYRSLSFDYTGRGESEGKFEDTTLSVNLEDIESALNFLDNEVIIIGNSFGAQSALHLAAKDKRVTCLAITSAAHDIEGWTEGKKVKQAIDRGFSFYSSSDKKLISNLFEDAKKYNTLKELSKIKIPILIIHGEKDSQIPVSQAKEIYENVNQPKKLEILKGEDHSFTFRGYEKTFQLIKEWINKWT